MDQDGLASKEIRHCRLGIEDPSRLLLLVVLSGSWAGCPGALLSGSEPNQDFDRTPSHPSGRSACADSQRQLLLIFRLRSHPRLPRLAFQKFVLGFAHCAHWLNLSRSFSVHPFPPFIYRLQVKTRARALPPFGRVPWKL